MIFLEYEEIKDKYLKIQDIISEILTEQENLFVIAQPKAVKPTLVKVRNNKQINSIENYLIAKDNCKIDKKLEEAKKILEARKFLLKQKEQELQQSFEIIDKIYFYRYVRGMNAEKIAYKLNYSISQIYRYIGQIKNLQDAKKCEKNCDILVL